MTQKIAVVIIHGAGSQGPDFADDMIEALTRQFASHLPAEDKAVGDKLAFSVVYWADILARKERILWQTVEADGRLSFKDLRQFIMNFGADAIAYQPGATRREVYDTIHQEMSDALTEVARQAGPEAPLCVIGHSIGTVITHNYFFDLAYDPPERMATRSLLESGHTLTWLYMAGSPLALWSLRYDQYKPIVFPGPKVAELFPQLQPRWVNFFDKDDILAYPIRSLSPGHKALFEQGLLQDIEIDAGNLLTSWNPMSHMGYWTDSDVIRPIAASLFEAWQLLNSAGEEPETDAL